MKSIIYDSIIYNICESDETYLLEQMISKCGGNSRTIEEYEAVENLKYNCVKPYLHKVQKFHNDLEKRIDEFKIKK